MPIDRITKEQLGVQPIDWSGLPREYLHPGELETIIHLARSVNAKHMMEIGCNNGRTAKALLDNVETIECYTGLDVLPGYEFEKRVQRKEVPPEPGKLALNNPRFELLLTANGSFDYKVNSKRYDVVFIDGDHSFRAVDHDTRLALQVLEPNGIIIWHDYHNLGTVDVKPFLDMYAQEQKLVHVIGTWLVYKQFN